MDNEDLKSYALRRLLLVAFCVLLMFMGGFFKICSKVPQPYPPTKEEFSI